MMLTKPNHGQKSLRFYIKRQVSVKYLIFLGITLGTRDTVTNKTQSLSLTIGSGKMDKGNDTHTHTHTHTYIYMTYIYI